MTKRKNYSKKQFNAQNILVLCFCYLLFGHFVFSQAVKDTTYFQEVILKASPLQQSLFKAPSSVGFIQSKDINHTDGTMLTSLLNSISGVQMQQGNWNTNRISIRGQGARSQFSTNRIKLYLNEIPITSAEGESILEDIDLNHIHSIEIFKGPNSTAFGAGTGGVIRIETKEDVHKDNIELFSSAGGFGMMRLGISAKLNQNNWSHTLTLTQQQIEGFRENSTYRRSQLMWQSDYQFNSKNNLQFLVLLTDLKAFIPSTITFNDFQQNPSLAAANWRAAKGYEAYQRSIIGVTHRYKSDNQWILKNSVFSQFRQSDEPRPFDIIDDQLHILGLRSVVQKQINAFKNPLQFSLGFEGMTEQYQLTLFQNLYQQFPGQGSIRGESFASNAQNRHYIHLFSQLQWQISSWQFEAGLAYNATHYNIERPEQETFSFDAVFLPRVGISKFFSTNHHVYVSWSSGFAVPTLAESLTVNGNFNTNLEPEQGFSYEIGYKWRSLNQNWQSTLAVFRMPVNHLLVARRIAEDQFEGRNAGSSLHQGIEWEGQYTLKLNNIQKVFFSTSITFNDFRFTDFLDLDIRHDGNALPAVPNWQTASRVVWHINSDWDFSLIYRYTGKMPLNDANSAFNDAFQVVDINTNYQFDFKKIKIKLQTGINNLFDTKYAASILPNAVAFGNAQPRYFYPGLPFQWHFGIRMQFPN